MYIYNNMGQMRKKSESRRLSIHIQNFRSAFRLLPLRVDIRVLSDVEGTYQSTCETEKLDRIPGEFRVLVRRGSYSDQLQSVFSLVVLLLLYCTASQ